MEQCVVLSWLEQIRHEIPERLLPEMRTSVIMTWPFHLQRAINREERAFYGRKPEHPDFLQYASWHNYKIVPGYEKNKVVVFCPEDLEGHIVFQMPPEVIAAIF